ncbi:MAG: alpha-xylosidase [Prevotella sp.]|nr:alpha-xylosidase [Prevotella sp.]
MKQTNYHLFDFMDFDPSLQRDESLWKADRPNGFWMHDGDICISVPFVRQAHAEDMAADPSGQTEEHTLVIRYYEPNIIRVFIDFEHADNLTPTDADDMLQYAEQIQKRPLQLFLDKGPRGHYYACTEDGVKRLHIVQISPDIDHWSDLQPAPQDTIDLRFFPDGEHEVRLASYDHFSPPRYDALPLGFCSVGQGIDPAVPAANERATISFRCEADECFVGTGERFRKMDLSGQTFQLKNQDGQGVNNRRCYKNIPFYLSSRMYGCFFHTTAYSKLSLADHSTRSVQFLSDQAQIDAFIIGGKTPEEILRGYRMLTGFPQMPPLWSFGIWMSRMTYFSADEVNDICDRLRSEHYPCDVIHLDTGWFRTDWLCEWKFNPERFPDPKGFVRNLADKGFRVSLWQLPYVAQGAEQIDEAKANHYISQPTANIPDDSPAGASSNFSALDYAGTIDFTYPKATEWYKSQLLRPLLEMGVKCIKTDFGENIHMDHKYHGMTPERLNNLYALLYQKAAYEVTKEVTGDGIVWARSAWAGCQRYPLHWGGDSASTWDGMAGSLKGGLHFGLSGFAFWSHDVPGFHTLPNFMNGIVQDDIYVRWTQFGVFSSHMRYHGTNKREPWHYPNIAPIVKRWWKLRYRLIPYIIEQGELCCRSGYPMVRALLFHHPHDRQCWHIDDEYYFGTDFLCCPVMNSAGRRDIYLPEGLWANFFTGERLQGGRWYYDVEVPLDQMPVFVRPGALIKLYPDDVDCTDQMDLSRAVTIEITKEYKGIEI